MQNEQITLNEFKNEVADMFTACFEGKLELCGDDLAFTFLNGQGFRISVTEATKQA